MLKRNDTLMSTKNCYIGGNTVKYIVVHYTGCYAPVKNFCLSQMNNDLNGSAHDFVDDNEWYCSIAHTNRAWSVGDDNGYGRFPNGITNSNTLNIEMVAKPYELPSAKTIENTAEIVAYYMKVYNVPLSRVVRHYDASYKPCPYGMHGNNNAKWNEFKNKVNYYYNGAKPQQTTTSQPSGDLCRIIVNGKSVIALTGLEKCKGYVKTNYPKEKVEIQRVSDGKVLFTQAKYVTPQPTYTSYKENGIFTFNTAVQIRNSTNESDTTGLCYYAGEEVIYDTVILNCNGFNWIVYTRNNGKRGYMKIKDLSTGERYGSAR